jgi:hypothetical protein
VETREQMVLRVLYHLERTPLSRFPSGPGCTSGRVSKITGEALRAPLSQQECVALRVEVLASLVQGWLPIVDRTVAVGFEIEGDDTTARIEPEGGDLALKRWSGRYFGGQYIPPPLWELLAGLGAVWSSQYAGLHVTESLLLVGDVVVVCGFGDRELAPDQVKTGGYRDVQETRPVIRSHPSMPLAISNDPIVLDPSSASVSPRLA